MLLSIPPFFFLDELDDFLATEEDPPEALAAYLPRIETFLNSSAASCSEENEMPIMHSCLKGNGQLGEGSRSRGAHIARESVEEGAILEVGGILRDLMGPDSSSSTL